MIRFWIRSKVLTTSATGLRANSRERVRNEEKWMFHEILGRTKFLFRLLSRKKTIRVFYENAPSKEWVSCFSTWFPTQRLHKICFQV
jgi:hypothetical protein